MHVQGGGITHCRPAENTLNARKTALAGLCICLINNMCGAECIRLHLAQKAQQISEKLCPERLTHVKVVLGPA